MQFRYSFFALCAVLVTAAITLSADASNRLERRQGHPTQPKKFAPGDPNRPHITFSNPNKGRPDQFIYFDKHMEVALYKGKECSGETHSFQLTLPDSNLGWAGDNCTSTAFGPQGPGGSQHGGDLSNFDSFKIIKSDKVVKDYTQKPVVEEYPNGIAFTVSPNDKPLNSGNGCGDVPAHLELDLPHDFDRCFSRTDLDLASEKDEHDKFINMFALMPRRDTMMER